MTAAVSLPPPPQWWLAARVACCFEFSPGRIAVPALLSAHWLRCRAGARGAWPRLPYY